MTIPKEDLDKRIVFTDTTKRQADFRIRLGYDGMTQSEFFRAMISGYLEQDRNLLDYVEKYKREKKRKKRQGKNSLKKNRDLYEKGQQTRRKFALDDDVIESIFDLMEEEHPDL
jgi:hypothetical protein|tara:strand:+ start:151 stop:492 length:342 start_codon:yes stop_codon:yes gene_type:complete